MENATDEQLIERYLDGDEGALPVLVNRYADSVYHFVYRFVGQAGDAEDITQDAFVNAWKNLKKFDPEKKFKTWIFTIAKNSSLNWVKKKKPLLFSEFSAKSSLTLGAEADEEGNTLAETVADSAPLPDELFEQKDLARKLSRAMERLTPAYRAVLLLRYNDHFTFREIAESLQESVHTIKSRHRRALLALRKILTANGSSFPREDTA